MWVDCHNCRGLGFIRYFDIDIDNDNNKPCHLCNYGNTTDPYLIGQIWVKDNYKPCTPPSSPRTR